jgi:hypothetical protein
MVRSLALLLATLLALVGTTAAAAGARELSVGADGRISLDLDDVPLEWVLGALGAALAVEVVVDGSLPGTISARFESLAPARAVRRLVGSRPLLMRWTAGGELRSIRVRGELAAAAPIPGEPGRLRADDLALAVAAAPPVAPAEEIDEASLRSLDRSLAQRVRDIQTDWRRTAGAAAVDDLDGEVAQHDPGLRRDAIRALVRAGDGAAAARLGELLEVETDPGLRRLALGALAGIDDPLARELLEAALR